VSDPDETAKANIEHTLRTLPAGVVSREGHLIVVRVADGWRQTIDDAHGLLDAVALLSGGQRLPVLVDIRNAVPLMPEVRQVYTGPAVERQSMLALLVETSPFGWMMGSFYLRVARLGTPTRIFTSEESARAWLTP
jgi:hypothetical protein